LLMEKVGYEINTKGYKVLPYYFRVLQGDGITVDTIKIILDRMKEKGLSASNIAFGQGGGLLQQIDRDTLKFAMKASAIMINGKWRDVFKDPITDKGKRSKKGRLASVINSVGNFTTLRESDLGSQVNVLQDVFVDGVLLNTTTFAEVRKRAATGIK
jgi:nicotinamide phosphoribosyltransferase